MCRVTLTFDSNNKVKVNTEEITIDSSIEEDPAVKDIVAEYTCESWLYIKHIQSKTP